MTNLKYLKRIKELDKKKYADDDSSLIKSIHGYPEHRKVKALEIIAEELCRLNKWGLK